MRPKCNATLAQKQSDPSGNYVYQWWFYFRTTGDVKSALNYTNLHMGGGNLLFADGHAKWKKSTAMRSSDFGLTPDHALIPSEWNNSWNNAF